MANNLFSHVDYRNIFDWYKCALINRQRIFLSWNWNFSYIISFSLFAWCTCSLLDFIEFFFFILLLKLLCVALRKTCNGREKYFGENTRKIFNVNNYSFLFTFFPFSFFPLSLSRLLRLMRLPSTTSQAHFFFLFFWIQPTRFCHSLPFSSLGLFIIGECGTIFNKSNTE